MGDNRPDGINVELDRADHGYGSENRGTSPLHDWRLKAAVQTLLSHLPRSERLNYIIQRHLTRTLPISDEELVGQVAKAQRNVDAFLRHGSAPLAEATFFEFGVGWDMLMPLVYHSMGVDRQIVVDIKPLARVDLVEDVARRLAAAAPRLGLPRRPFIPHASGSVMEVAAALGIEYRAPADARALDLPDASVDMVSSCDVLEHVPPDDIGAILIECRRVLRDDGIARMRIDYQDHFWYFDAHVSPYNFLRFDERTWRRFNPALHYQNRLRHDSVRQLVIEAGWEIIEEEAHEPTPADLRLIASMTLAEPFRSAPHNRLAIRFANMTMAKATSPGRRSAR